MNGRMLFYRREWSNKEIIMCERQGCNLKVETDNLHFTCGFKCNIFRSP